VDVAEDDTGVLLIRVWREGRGIRARLLTPPGSDPPVVIVAASVDDVVAAVREWLLAFELE
jgi:hypothetical protein